MNEALDEHALDEIYSHHAFWGKHTDLVAELVDRAPELLAPDRQHVAVLLELAQVPCVWKRRGAKWEEALSFVPFFRIIRGPSKISKKVTSGRTHALHEALLVLEDVPLDGLLHLSQLLRQLPHNHLRPAGKSTWVRGLMLVKIRGAHIINGFNQRRPCI